MTHPVWEMVRPRSHHLDRRVCRERSRGLSGPRRTAALQSRHHLFLLCDTRSDRIHLILRRSSHRCQARQGHGIQLLLLVWSVVNDYVDCTCSGEFAGLLRSGLQQHRRKCCVC